MVKELGIYRDSPRKKGETLKILFLSDEECPALWDYYVPGRLADYQLIILLRGPEGQLSELSGDHGPVPRALCPREPRHPLRQ